jgi:hypothetical protein
MFFVSQQAIGARGGRSNRLEVTMMTSLQEIQLKRGNTLEKIKVKGNVDERQEVIVCCKVATLKWKGFESQIAIWTKIYERI